MRDSPEDCSIEFTKALRLWSRSHVKEAHIKLRDFPLAQVRHDCTFLENTSYIQFLHLNSDQILHSIEEVSFYIRTCRGLKDTDFAGVDAIIQRTHKLQLDVVGRIGMEVALSPLVLLETVHDELR